MSIQSPVNNGWEDNGEMQEEEYEEVSTREALPEEKIKSYTGVDGKRLARDS